MAGPTRHRRFLLLAAVLVCAVATAQPLPESVPGLPEPPAEALPEAYTPPPPPPAARITGVTELATDTKRQEETASLPQVKILDVVAAPDEPLRQPLEQGLERAGPFSSPPLSLDLEARQWTSTRPSDLVTDLVQRNLPTFAPQRQRPLPDESAAPGRLSPATTTSTPARLAELPVLPPPPIGQSPPTTEVLPPRPGVPPPAAEPAQVTPAPHGAPCWPGDYSPFSPDPDYSELPYSAAAELDIYTGRWCIPTQRPWVELWRPLYAPGELPPGLPILGERNLVLPHFLLYGDFRTAFAFNDNGANDKEKYIWANRLNLDFDWKITATERIHAFWGPIDEDGRFTRAEENDGQIEFFEEFDDDFDTLFFEGDIGYIWGGMTDQYAPFDLPIVAGKYPLLFQNGIWLVDALEGLALTIPAQNSPLFDWSNTDLTFFFSFDDVDSPAFGKDDNLANAYGFNWFLEAYDGYWEIGYAFLEDTTGQGLSYNNIGLAYTRRYLQRISNSIRVIVNAGQDPVVGEQTADGTLLLIENALVSHNPPYFVPYCNLFAGFGRPQSVARAAGAGGILLNTGINFETDGLTGFPTLDDTANDTYGGAVGVNWLGPEFSWQLITELAMVKTHGNDPNRNAQNDQYGVGMRFQLPLTNAWLVRLDSMYGIIENEPDIRGARMELRWKF